VRSIESAGYCLKKLANKPPKFYLVYLSFGGYNLRLYFRTDFMNKISENWLLKTPIDALSFDCDGTLSAIEGIDELAVMNGVGPAVQKLTEEAMAKTGLNEALYQYRLNLVKPTQDQTLALAQQYFSHKVPDLLEVIQLLQSLKKELYIISAGLYPSVFRFAQLLNIPGENVFSVNINFDSEGHYVDFDHSSPLITDEGKNTIGAELKKKHPRIIHVGDGLNDYSIKEQVVRFIGYGGVFYRERIAALCEYYVKPPSMASILPLCLTQQEAQQLTVSQRALYQKGLELLWINHDL